MATLQPNNLIQHTLLHHLRLLTMSNNISGAFEALSKYAQILGWECGGVPSDVALFLASLDENGVCISRTPASEHAALKHTLASLNPP